MNIQSFKMVESFNTSFNRDLSTTRNKGDKESQEPAEAELEEDWDEDEDDEWQAYANAPAPNSVPAQRRKFMMRPDTKFRRCWELIQSVLLVYVALVVPVRVGFGTPSEGASYAIDILCDLYFLVDLFLNFFTGYYHKKRGILEIVMARKKVIKHYLTHWFIIDALSCAPVDHILRMQRHSFLCSFVTGRCRRDLTNSTGQLFRLFKALRLARLVKLLRKTHVSFFDRYQDSLLEIMRFLTILKQLFFLLFIGHLVGCLFYYFSTPEWRTDAEQAEIDSGQLTTWTIREFGTGPLDEAPINDRYVASIYWAFTTMTTVGYGDISATTKAERIFAIIGMIIGGFVFSGIIGSVGATIQGLHASRNAFRQKMECVSAFMIDAGVPKQVQARAMRFFRQQDVKAYHRQGIIMELPFELRSDVIHAIHHNLISQSPFFADCDAVFITEFCSRMQPLHFPKATVVYRRGEISRQFYILAKGTVEFLDPVEQDRVLAYVDMGSFFGEGGALGEHVREDTTRTSTPCLMGIMQVADMEEMMSSYEHMLPRLHALNVHRRRILRRMLANTNPAIGPVLLPVTPHRPSRASSAVRLPVARETPIQEVSAHEEQQVPNGDAGPPLVVVSSEPPTVIAAMSTRSAAAMSTKGGSAASTDAAAAEVDTEGVTGGSIPLDGAARAGGGEGLPAGSEPTGGLPAGDSRRSTVGSLLELRRMSDLLAKYRLSSSRTRPEGRLPSLGKALSRLRRGSGRDERAPMGSVGLRPVLLPTMSMGTRAEVGSAESREVGLTGSRADFGSAAPGVDFRMSMGSTSSVGLSGGNMGTVPFDMLPLESEELGVIERQDIEARMSIMEAKARELEEEVHELRELLELRASSSQLDAIAKPHVEKKPYMHQVSEIETHPGIKPLLQSGSSNHMQVESGIQLASITLSSPRLMTGD